MKKQIMIPFLTLLGLMTPFMVGIAQTECRCLVLDGDRDYVSVPPLECFPNLTIEMWVYRNDMSHYDGLFGVQNWGNFGDLHYEISPSSGWCFHVDYCFPDCSPVTIWAGSWCHLAVTFSRGNALSYYENGQAAGGDGSNLDCCIRLLGGVRIGSVADLLDDRFFYGKIDEVRLWNYVRSQQEINQQMYVELTGTEPGLVLYYNFSDQGDSVIYDLSPNNHDGILSGDAHTDWSTAPVAACDYWVNWLISPDEGDVWHLYHTDTIRWTTGDTITEELNIELNRDYPAGQWEMLQEGTPDDGEEPIFVGGVPSNACRVRISTASGSHRDISNRDFTIASSSGFLALVEESSPNNPLVSWNAGILECPTTSSETFHFKNLGSEPIVVFQPSEPVSVEFFRTTSCPDTCVLNPGQMSTCEVMLIFDPLADGFYRDTLFVQSDAVNGQGGYVRFPLSGEQISTPDSPQVVIATEGNDARLRWNPITQSIYGCPIDVTHYLVFYSPTFSGPYYYHGYTADTTYVHLGVVRYATGQFYDVTATTAPLPLLQALPSGEAKLTREEVLDILRR